MLRLTLYGRAECTLCDAMKAVVDAVAREVPLTLETVDVDTDPALVAAYGNDVPVLHVNGREAFRHRVDAGRLRARLAEERG